MTAFEMRISDWSSDVCSSDLPSGAELFAVSGTVVNPTAERQRVPDIRAELRDAHGRLVYSWTITPQQRTLGPRGTIEFNRSEEHTSELQSLMRISYAVFCLKKKSITKYGQHPIDTRHTQKN